MIISDPKSLAVNNFHMGVHVSVSQAPESVIDTPTTPNDGNIGGALAHDFDAFYRRHPKAARDLLYILEVYKKCDRVALTLDPPSFEEAYLHVLGGPNQAPCERCNPAFDREKRILGVPASR